MLLAFGRFCYDYYMETLIHADIFFFISSIGCILIVILLATALVYLIRLLRKIDRLAQQLKDRAHAIGQSAEGMIDDIRESPAFGFLVHKKRKAKTTSRPE
jgi:hypothetical protein